MPSFSSLGQDAIGNHIADNLTMVGVGAAATRKIAFNVGKGKEIYEIGSNHLPHSMHLFMHTILNQQNVVDGRKFHTQLNFLKERYDGVPRFAANDNVGRAEKAAGYTEFETRRMRELGIYGADEDALPAAGVAIPADLERKLRKKLYDANDEHLYCMRSVHVDKDGWLPPVQVPAAPIGAAAAYHTYISRYTALPKNIQGKAGVAGNTITAYIEYNAGHKSAVDEFSEPRWRILYDWVNQRFFLTFHYQPDFFTTTDGTFTAKSPWLHITQQGTHGIAGPGDAVVNPARNFAKHLQNKRGMVTRDFR